MGGFAERGIRHAAICLMLSASAALIFLRGPASFAADPRQPAIGAEVLLVVKGVATPFSEFGLIHHLSQIPGVRTVHFDLLHGLADVKLKPGATISDEDFRRAIRGASYTPGPIRWVDPPPGSPSK